MLKRIITNPNLLVEDVNGKLTLKVKDGGSNRNVAVATGGCGGDEMVNTTYTELKKLRDESKLIPGMKYRITDYHTTTSQQDTRSADKQFDIIVTADTQSVLNENARAINHIFEKTEIHYCIAEYSSHGETMYVVFQRWPSADYEEDSVHYYGWIYVYNKWEHAITEDDLDNCNWNNDHGEYDYTTQEVPEVGSLVSDYLTVDSNGVYMLDADQFRGVNLSAWQLKYCIDNDETRFRWAQHKQEEVHIVDYFIIYGAKVDYEYEVVEYSDSYYRIYDRDRSSYWYISPIPVPVPEYYTITLYEDSDLSIEERTITPDYYHEINIPYAEEGTGVIYYMRDEFNNEAPFDFKNILFKFYDEEFFYAFSYVDEYTGSVEDYSVYLYRIPGGSFLCSNNKIAAFYDKDDALVLQFNVMIVEQETPMCHNIVHDASSYNFIYNSKHVTIERCQDLYVGYCDNSSFVQCTDCNFERVNFSTFNNQVDASIENCDYVIRASVLKGDSSSSSSYSNETKPQAGGFLYSSNILSSQNTLSVAANTFYYCSSYNDPTLTLTSIPMLEGESRIRIHTNTSVTLSLPQGTKYTGSLDLDSDEEYLISIQAGIVFICQLKSAE